MTAAIRATAAGYHVRWMIRRDLDGGVLSLAWLGGWAAREEDFVSVLRQRNCIGMVAERGEDLAGFMVYELHKRKLVIIGMAAATPAVAQTMAEKLQGKLSAHRRTSVEFLAREDDADLMGALLSVGFTVAGVERGAFGGRDGYLLSYHLPGSRAAAGAGEDDTDTFVEG
jgi:ribosomal-protein-alanine N-acetyltransferase